MTISRRRRMRRIGALPEGRQAHAAERVDEAFTLGAQRAIRLDDTLDGRCDIVLPYRRTDDFTQRSEAVRRAAERNLVPLLAMLVDAEDADVADVVMPARIHAAGHLYLDVAQVVQVVEIVEALLDLLRDPERAGIGERAEIQPRAGDHVRKGADVRHGELVAFELEPHLVQLALAHVREQQILIVGGADEAEAHALGERCDRLHLLTAHIPRVLSVRFERYEHRAIPAHAVGTGIVAIPGLEGGFAAGAGVEVLERLVGLRPEEAAHPLDFGGRQARSARARALPLGFHLLAEALDT